MFNLLPNGARVSDAANGGCGDLDIVLIDGDRGGGDVENWLPIFTFNARIIFFLPQCNV